MEELLINKFGGQPTWNSESNRWNCAHRIRGEEIIFPVPIPPAMAAELFVSKFQQQVVEKSKAAFRIRIGGFMFSGFSISKTYGVAGIHQEFQPVFIKYETLDDIPAWITTVEFADGKQNLFYSFDHFFFQNEALNTKIGLYVK
jgi:hypothetical protein